MTVTSCQFTRTLLLFLAILRLAVGLSMHDDCCGDLCPCRIEVNREALNSDKENYPMIETPVDPIEDNRPMIKVPIDEPNEEALQSHDTEPINVITHEVAKPAQLKQLCCRTRFGIMYLPRGCVLCRG